MTQIGSRAEGLSVGEIERACAPSAGFEGLPIRPVMLQLLRTYARRRSVKEKEGRARAGLIHVHDVSEHN
jgi:hypothetical protein